MAEYGMALEIMHTDPDWLFDDLYNVVENPAPPCPDHLRAVTLKALEYNYKQFQATTPELVDVECTFLEPRVRFYIEEILNEEREVIDTITHYDTWTYTFAWYATT
jgi:hypothetical protein